MPENDGEGPARRSTSRRGATSVLVAVLSAALIIPAAITLVTFSSEDEQVVSRPTPAPPPSPGSGAPKSDSLFTEAVLADRLEALEADSRYEGVSFVSLKPDLLTVNLRRDDSETDLVLIRATGPPEVLDTIPTDEGELFPLSDVDPAAPERLIAQVLDAGRTFDQINYLGVSSENGTIGWQAQIKDDTVFFANEGGSVIDTLP